LDELQRLEAVHGLRGELHFGARHARIFAPKAAVSVAGFAQKCS
jgi:hypothetical protein